MKLIVAAKEEYFNDIVALSDEVREFASLFQNNGQIVDMTVLNEWYASIFTIEEKLKEIREKVGENMKIYEEDNI
ncbi:hypothetical protein EBB07_28690 [Paenibacillaceae bacterium]|nr:hypothetical protein EBB07_28690 [Paenibacillaceae bacterium]